MSEPCRILAVDNELSVTSSFRYIFTAPRYQITCVESGDAALVRLEANPDGYDVIIVDHKMPRLSGVELVQEIRQRGIATSIMVVSANLSSDVREAYERLDVHIMFTKPFNVNELRATVDHLAA